MRRTRRRLRQTDHGRLYYKTPSSILAPTSIEELARMLARLDADRRRVTIRNTAHSTNGQTLTDEVQVQVGGIKKIRFDEDRGVVTAGAGNSWDSVIRGMQFPRYCPAVFPGGPDQRIHVGGTASVGGVGHYSSRHGGFWNQVAALKLVTMSGDIIECSPQEHGDLFRHVLGGHGRVGVIGELDIKAVPSKPNVVSVAMLYRDTDAFLADFSRALDDPRFSGVIAGEDLSGWEHAVLSRLGIRLRIVVAMMEVDEGEDAESLIDDVLDTYDEESHFFMEACSDERGLEVRMLRTVYPKRGIVYYSMREDDFLQRLLASIKRLILGKARAGRLCPYADCVVDADNYPAFVDEAARIIRAHDMAKWLEKEAFVHGFISIDSFITYGIKKMTSDPQTSFPLTLDLPHENGHARGLAIMPKVPESKREEGLLVERALTDLVYELGGRRYLYGSHSLTREQIEQHFGCGVLDEWQTLKDEHDPHHLLNIGVIEHLD